MSACVGKLAPDFSIQAYDRTKDDTSGQFLQVNLSDYQGKWVCLYFYPLDFTFVCPTEIVMFNESLAEFGSRNCALLTASTDSVFSHKGW
ncbi:MAG: thioredoxin peroxidase, partial [Planctomycetales bacterium 12-60-4]